MAPAEALPESPPTPQQSSTDALVLPDHAAAVADVYPRPVDITMPQDAPVGQGNRGAGRFVEWGHRIRHSRVVAVAAKLAVTSAVTVTLLLDGASPAEASPSTAEAPFPDLGNNLSGILATFGLLATAWSIRSQTKQKTEEGLRAALQGIKGESTGEERLARLNALEPYAAHRRYAPEVFKAATAYLRGRRGGLIKLQQDHAGDPIRHEGAITDRRNADRGAFRLLLETLPRVRRQIQRPVVIKRFAKIVDRDGADASALRQLDTLTGLQVDAEMPRVNAKGINLDDMRGEVQSCNLSRVDLTGAGLQRNDIKRVIFKDSRLCEAQLEGSRLFCCDLQGADLRAAYFGNTNHTIIERCVIDADTRFGNLPDNHPDARVGMLEPDRADEYRGIPRVVLRDLCSDTLSADEIIEMVRGWQRNGLVLEQGSNPEYFLNP